MRLNGATSTGGNICAAKQTIAGRGSPLPDFVLVNIMIFFSEPNARLQFFNGGNLTCRSGFLHQHRLMECCVLIYVLSGSLNISTSGREYCVSGGEYILLNSGAEHLGTSPSPGGLSYLWAHFRTDPPLSESAAQGGFILPEYAKSCSQRVCLLFRQLIDISRRDIYTPRMAECALEMLLTEITQQQHDLDRSASPLPPLIADINEWIRLNCHRELSLSDIAEAFHYNAEYLSGTYRRITGTTLTSKINRTRIELSKQLLSDRSVSIKEAAFSCGFSDEKYFLRVFRKYEGMTPEQFRTAIGVK